MNLDDYVCLCFRVTKRKVINYIRIHRPRRAGQLSQCYGAGTGCGWCRPYLKQLLETRGEEERHSRAAKIADLASSSGGAVAIDQISAEQYARRRSQYVHDGGGTPPPGAIPVDPIQPG